MLEAVLDCLRCVEAPDVLMRQPEELTPEQSHPMVVGESLGDVVGIGRDQENFKIFRIWRSLVASDPTFCASNGSPTIWGSQSV